MLYAKMQAERRAKIDGYVFPEDRRLCLAAGLLLERCLREADWSAGAGIRALGQAASGAGGSPASTLAFWGAGALRTVRKRGRLRH